MTEYARYQVYDTKIPFEHRADVNEKILYLITNDLVENTDVTPDDIYNSYTGDGGLHGLHREDFDNYNEYKAAKKEIEQGQFFTSPEICRYVVDCLRPGERDIVYDLTCGMGSFFNFLPAERNIYGADVDLKALKVAKYLFPQANLSHEDIRTYQAPILADLVIGNPPFHLNWSYDGDTLPSQLFYCLKAAGILKPGGLLAVIMPGSFLDDEFLLQGQIERMNGLYDFVVQADLPKNAFQHVGISSFATKLMVFRRKSRHLPEKPYSLAKAVQTGAGHIYETYVLPAVEQRERQRAKILLERSDARVMDKAFHDKVTKLLYDIRQNPKTAVHLGRCETMLNRFLTQKKPDKVSWEEWEKMRVTERMVLDEMKRTQRGANRVYRDERLVVKTNDAFVERDYREGGDDRIISSINDAVIDGGVRVPGFEQLLSRKRRAYRIQSQDFEEMGQDGAIYDFLNDWEVYSELEERLIRLNDIQIADVNKLLQKRYGVLQYEMGSGKTLCGLAMAEYHLRFAGARNIFVVADALAINNTWEVVMEDYGIPFYRVNTRADVLNVPEKRIVLITLSMVVAYKKELKRLMRRLSNKAALIFDESDAISSPLSVRAKAMLSVFRRCRAKYLTTGTMTRNNITESASQFELLYNNSVNYVSWAEYIYETDKDGDENRVRNEYYGRPVPAYQRGYKLFSKSHLPHKITVFGIEKFTQDVYNADVLKDLLSKTVITRTFEEVAGRKIYDLNQIMVPFHQAEKNVYRTAVKAFHTMRWNYFNSTDNARKDSMFLLLQQLILLQKICADPASMVEYCSTQKSTKVDKVLEMLGEWEDERVAIGVRHVDIANAYAEYIREAFPGRPLFMIIGGNSSFKRRREVVKELEKTGNGILLSTQQAYSKSQNIDFVDRIILPELHYNNAAMSQYYFRFIRYTSVKHKNVYFLTYEYSIESNLIRMIMAKEKLNLFMKNQEVGDEELFERFSVDRGIFEMLMSKGVDEDGHMQLRWGEQMIA